MKLVTSSAATAVLLVAVSGTGMDPCTALCKTDFMCKESVCSSNEGYSNVCENYVVDKSSLADIPRYMYTRAWVSLKQGGLQLLSCKEAEAILNFFAFENEIKKSKVSIHTQENPEHDPTLPRSLAKWRRLVLTDELERMLDSADWKDFEWEVELCILAAMRAAWKWNYRVFDVMAIEELLNVVLLNQGDAQRKMAVSYLMFFVLLILENDGAPLTQAQKDKLSEVNLHALDDPQLWRSFDAVMNQNGEHLDVGFGLVDNISDLDNGLDLDDDDLPDSDLEEPELMMAHSYVSKRDFVRKHLEKHLNPNGQRERVLVERYNVLNSLNILFPTNVKTSYKDFPNRIDVTFDGEIAGDAGGPTHEYFSLLLPEIFQSPFFISRPNSKSFVFVLDIGTEEDGYNGPLTRVSFATQKQIGQALGLAVLLGISFPHPIDELLMELMLRPGIPSSLDTFKDMPNHQAFYNYNLDILRTNVTEYPELVGGYELWDGSPVTEQNKGLFVEQQIKNLVVPTLRVGIGIIRGFSEFLGSARGLPRSIVTGHEFVQMITAPPSFTGKELCEHVTKHNPVTPLNEEMIQWFCNIVAEFTSEQLQAFLLFTTSRMNLPPDGFAGLKPPIKFDIDANRDTKQLPTTHTCFNQLVLPRYKEQSTFQQKLKFAISESKEYGFV